MTAEKGKITIANRKRLEDLRLFDDRFMTVCFSDSIKAVELVLRIILNSDKINVTKVTTQKEMKNLVGRSVKLDIVAEDASGKVTNIEIQRQKTGAGEKRARYHASILDTNSLMQNQTFEQLPDTYVIFITETDVFGKGKPVYRIRRLFDDTFEPFDDGSAIIYVNGEYRDTATSIGRMMHDFACTNPDEMFYKELATQVRRYKNADEGGNEMSGVFEQIREEDKVEDLKCVMDYFNVSLEQALTALKIPQDEQPKYYELLNKD